MFHCLELPFEVDHLQMHSRNIQKAQDRLENLHQDLNTSQLAVDAAIEHLIYVTFLGMLKFWIRSINSLLILMPFSIRWRNQIPGTETNFWGKCNFEISSSKVEFPFVWLQNPNFYCQLQRLVFSSLFFTSTLVTSIGYGIFLCHFSFHIDFLSIKS